MKRKIIQLSLAAILFVQTAAQADMSSYMMNITLPGTHTIKDASGNETSVGFYSGGVVYRFSGSTMPPPIFYVSPPKIEAGCNGLNVKGMFMSLLGLDQLGSMLQNAGATLAWGVAIGLIYSLPGVASAFRMINEWATKLQQILGQMCNSGIALGKMLGEKAMDSMGFDKDLVSGADNAVKTLQDGVEGTLKEFGLGDLFNKDGTINWGGSSSPRTLEDQKDLVSKFFKKRFLVDASIGASYVDNFFRTYALQNTFKKFFSNLEADLVKPVGYQDFYITDDGSNSNAADATYISLTDFVNSSGSDTGKRIFEMAYLGYLLSYNVAGDLGLDASRDGITSDFMNFIGKPTDDNKQEAATILAQPEKMGTPVLKLKGGALRTPEAAGKIIANFLIYGVKSGANAGNQNAVDPDELKVPMFTMIAAKEDKTNKTKFIPIMPVEGAEIPFFSASSNFKGVEEASKCVIEAMVNNNNIKLATEADYVAMQTKCGLSILFTGIDSYLKTILNSPFSDKAALTDALVKYNTKAAVYELLNQVSNNMKAVSNFQKQYIDYGTSNNSGNNNMSNDKGGTQPISNGIIETQKIVEKFGKAIEFTKKEMSIYSISEDKLKLDSIFVEKERQNNIMKNKEHTNRQ